MMAHSFSPCSGEADAGGSLLFGARLIYIVEFQASQNYTVRDPVLKSKTKVACNLVWPVHIIRTFRKLRQDRHECSKSSLSDIEVIGLYYSAPQNCKILVN